MAHGERVHLWRQRDELDDRIVLRLVLEVAYLAGVVIASKKFEAGQMARVDIAKVDGVVKPTSRFDLFLHILHEEVKEERVGVRVQHTNTVAEGILQKRVKTYLY